MRWDCMNGAPDVRATRLILGCHSLTNTVTGVVPPPELLISANPVDRWTKTAGMSVAGAGINGTPGLAAPPPSNPPPPPARRGRPPLFDAVLPPPPAPPPLLFSTTHP